MASSLGGHSWGEGGAQLRHTCGRMVHDMRDDGYGENIYLYEFIQFTTFTDFGMGSAVWLDMDGGKHKGENMRLTVTQLQANAWEISMMLHGQLIRYRYSNMAKRDAVKRFKATFGL